MAELPIGEIRRLFEELQEDNSRNWFLSTLVLIIFILLLYFVIAGYLLVNNIVDTKLVQYPTDFVEKIVNFSTPAHIFILFLIITILFLFSIFLLWLKDLYWRNKNYFWQSSNKLNNWDFQGIAVIENDDGEDIIKIKSSLLGMILKNRSWRNFKMTFKFLVPKKISYGQDPNKNQLERGFGIIYRARNLCQYYMLKIDESGFRPHINNNQLWEDLGPTITNDKPSSEWLDKWISVEMEMNNNVLSTSIGGKKFSIQLPTYSLVYRRFPKKHEEDTSSEPIPFLPLTCYDVGSIGFRSAPLEEVHIKNLEIISESLLTRIVYEAKRLLFR